MGRKEKLIKQKTGFEKFKSDVRRINPDESFINFPFHEFKQKSSLEPKPEYSELITYFNVTKDSFAKENLNFENNVFKIPRIFSLIESYEETTSYLRKLFNALFNETHKEILIDYGECELIDVGASMCMDIILSEFFKYFDKSVKGRHTIKIKNVTPINFEKEEIKKILFSIGAFSSIKGVKIKFDNIHPFPIIVGNKKNKSLEEQRELNITRTVEYIIECLSKMNKALKDKAETNLYKVIGEVLQNADEHSNTTNRYSVGYFESTKNGEDQYGVFSLAILNFGNTFYETFKNPECQNQKIVDQMTNLSKDFTNKGFFRSSEFEEETLWTLYALQDGVTRIHDWDRGNGAIRFIESFFKLKGNDVCDNVSKMVLTSGRTRIIFDGSYQIVKKVRGSENKEYKMMTFNNSGNIEDKPDDKFVKCENNYFPGTLISAKIRIDYENTQNI